MPIARDVLARFWKKLGHLLKGGVPLVRILEVLHAEHLADPLGPAIDRIAARLLEGQCFSWSAAQEPALFGPDTVLLLDSGEQNGRLDHAVLDIAALVADGTLSIPAPDAAAAPGLPALAASDAAAVPVLREAVARGATSVHVEQTPAGGTVRLRVGGRLQLHATLDRAGVRALVISLKILSCLDLAENRLPQDGRVRFDLDGRRVGFSTTIVPGDLGESACVRFDPPVESPPVSAEEYFGDARLARDAAALVRTRGALVLVTGPGGSGKSATVRTLLRQLDLEGLKVVSIEDGPRPILPGVQQIQPRPWIGLTHPAILQSALRGDPDVLCTTAVPDHETLDLLVRHAAAGRTAIAELAAPDAAAAIDLVVGRGLERGRLDRVLAGVFSQCRAGSRPSFELKTYTSRTAPDA